MQLLMATEPALTHSHFKLLTGNFAPGTFKLFHSVWRWWPTNELIYQGTNAHNTECPSDIIGFSVAATAAMEPLAMLGGWCPHIGYSHIWFTGKSTPTLADIIPGFPVTCHRHPLRLNPRRCLGGGMPRYSSSSRQKFPILPRNPHNSKYQPLEQEYWRYQKQ